MPLPRGDVRGGLLKQDTGHIKSTAGELDVATPQQGSGEK